MLSNQFSPYFAIHTAASKFKMVVLTAICSNGSIHGHQSSHRDYKDYKDRSDSRIVLIK